MKILPRSAFGQTILLIGVLLLINQAVSLVTIMVYYVQPQSDQVDQLLAKQVRVVFLDVKDPVLTPAMAKAFNQETGESGIQEHFMEKCIAFPKYKTLTITICPH